MPTVYHYCSTATFAAIAQNKKLRLSDTRFMNDGMEGLWARKLFIDRAREVLDAETFGLYHETILAEEAPVCLMLCMSVIGDALSQWRAYADDGKGFSVGFNIGVLDLIPEKAMPSGGAVDYTLQEPASVWLVERLKNAISHHGLQSNAVKSVFVEMSTADFKAKSPAFHEEQEYRLVQRNMEMVTGYQPRGDCVVPYAEYPLIPGPNGGQSINKVYLGPKNRTPISVVQKMMEPFGEVEVLRSAATYR